MKFEKITPEPQFRPIVITLESLKEVQALRAALAGVVGHGLDDDFLFKLYEKLDNQLLASERGFTTEGTVHLRKA